MSLPGPEVVGAHGGLPKRVATFWQRSFGRLASSCDYRTFSLLARYERAAASKYSRAKWRSYSFIPPREPPPAGEAVTSAVLIGSAGADGADVHAIGLGMELLPNGSAPDGATITHRLVNLTPGETYKVEVRPLCATEPPGEAEYEKRMAMSAWPCPGFAKCALNRFLSLAKSLPILPGGFSGYAREFPAAEDTCHLRGRIFDPIEGDFMSEENYPALTG
eukprot:930777-Prorocentrum_minimum.AAC.1